MQNSIVEFYSQPQTGGSMPVFAGARRYQNGGGFFSNLFRFAVPLLKRIGGRVLNVGMRTATDVLQNNRPIADSLINHTLDEVKSVINRPRDSSINKEGAGDIFNSYLKRRRR